jgi:hypothetical protein
MTAWTPLKPGGANFRTHTLVQRDGHQIAIRQSVGFFLFGAAFLGAGAICSAIGVGANEWMVGLFGLPFIAVGAWVVVPRWFVFDAQTREYRAGGKKTPFAKIHAIQILPEHVDGGDSADYTSYELNLVLKDGQRVNVVDHGHLASIREKSHRIAGHVGCAVWDTTL